MRTSAWLVLLGALVGCSGPRSNPASPTEQHCPDIAELVSKSCEIDQRCDYDRLRCDCVPDTPYVGGAPRTAEPPPEPITEGRFQCRDRRCPETFPAAGTPCNPSGLTCNAGVDAHSAAATCEDGAWQVTPGETPASAA